MITDFAVLFAPRMITNFAVLFASRMITNFAVLFASRRTADFALLLFCAQTDRRHHGAFILGLGGLSTSLSFSEPRLIADFTILFFYLD
jgi:hypothetical protein